MARALPHQLRVRPLDCQPHATGAILENQALDRARTAECCHAETAPLAANKYAPPRTLAVSAACTGGHAVDTPAQISHLTADGHRSGRAQCCCAGGMREDATVMYGLIGRGAPFTSPSAGCNLVQD
jgi:hypothetical protein